MAENLGFITIEPKGDGFVAFISFDSVMSIDKDPEVLLQEATKEYERAIINMRILITHIQEYRANRKPIPARIIWRLGNLIFQLKDMFESLSIQLNDIYGHLVRDLNMKRKWLEKVIIFRRYLPKEELIPESLNWGRCEKGTRRIAEQLQKGLPIG